MPNIKDPANIYMQFKKFIRCEFTPFKLMSVSVSMCLAIGLTILPLAIFSCWLNATTPLPLSYESPLYHWPLCFWRAPPHQ